MATASKTATAGEVIASTVKYSNKDNAERKYDITADVETRNGTVQNISNGQVSQRQTNPDAMTAANASFNTWSSEGLSVNFNGANSEEQTEIFAGIQAFIAAVRSEA